jgi:hypothetical protein
MHIIFSFFGILTILYVFFRIIMEIRDNYENKNEDEYTRMLIDKLRVIHPSVDKIVKELRFFEGDKSYTIDKKYVFLCKRDPKTGQQYHDNQLILVLIHEISHALCPDVGHTDTFHKINDGLLEIAIEMGLYDDSIQVSNYCE